MKGTTLYAAYEWHLDALDELSILKYVWAQNRAGVDLEPSALGFHPGWPDWFQEQKRLLPRPVSVRHLGPSGASFIARLDAR